ncbi:hypothetical protein AKJ41_02680 [candidate division MSBL1 archaeon SCGC-AAA259O05]|uniref:Flavin prenyltransferase UbiX n=1 Tax=candidate division MSBL1 archaeon SCGC-AAA259O05 TaxID=1698271 RepID=A0A133V3W9_9EURY|nr:hypothetical protein AKJ41_02680 [candidate division MSBL1 archaeon SCGC-AAA259O05]
MNLILAITGASGVVYGKKLLEVFSEKNIQTNLIVSPAAKKIIGFEIDEEVDDLQKKSIKCYESDELEAPISSGSVSVDGMVIAPCSMKTLSSISAGISHNLITRAADVTLKEGRKLVLVPRETPLNYIHLRNMTDLSQMGVTILPAAPAFYHSPTSAEDLVNFVVGKVLEQFGIEHGLYPSWDQVEGKNEL